MAYLLFGMLAASVLGALLTGQAALLGTAALEGAQTAVTLGISIAGAICLWSGVGTAMQKNGMAAAVARLFSPLLRRLFPSAAKDPQTAGYLGANFTANLLGLGNAATPMGIAAVKGMQRRAKGTAASDEMCRLIVMNTASIQLLPTTVAAVRSGLGAGAPFDILPAVWLTSLCSVTVGLGAAAILSKIWQD